MVRCHVRFVVVVAAVAALTGVLSAQTPASGRGYSAEDWPFAGGDQSSSRYSTLTEISKDTVDRLGGVWLVGTVDPDLGMVYFSTGNPVPMFGGEVREGDNLFTAAVLALDMKTGERKWHYQVVRHDVWDADIATPMLLYAVEVDAYDALTGERLRAFHTTPGGSAPRDGRGTRHSLV